MAGYDLTKPYVFSQPGCRRGTKRPAVLHTSSHTGMDMYGLIFSLGSVQEVTVSYIALHLSSTESGVKNYRSPQGQEDREGRTVMEEKKEILPSPVATSG